MSDPRAQPHSAVTVNRPAHTHVSATLPQHSTHKPTQTPVDPRPHASAPPPRRSPKSATLSAIATLPAPTRSPKSVSSSSATTLESFPPSSLGTMSNARPSAYTSSSSSTNRQPSQLTQQVNPRSVSGSLDRFASRPVSHVVLKQESMSDFERGGVANATVPAKALGPSHRDSGSPRSLSASQPQRNGVTAASQSGSNASINAQDTSVSSSQRPVQLTGQARPSAAQSRQLQSVTGQPSPPEAAFRMPQRAPKARNVQPMQSPRMAATVRSSQGPQSKSQANAASSATSSNRQASRDGNHTQTQSPQVSQAPLINTTPSNPKSAAPPSSQRPRAIQFVDSAIVAQASPDTAGKERAQPSAKVAPAARPIQSQKQVGPSAIPNPPLQAAGRPANPLNGRSTLGSSKQATTNTSLNTAASTSNPREDVSWPSSPAASSPNQAFDPETLLGLRGSFLTSSEPVDYDSLISDNGKCKPVSAVSCLEYSDAELDQLIIELVEHQGEPLVISDLDKRPAWNSDLFSPQSYESLRPRASAETDNDTVLVRNLTDWTDHALPLHDFMARCDRQWTYPPEQVEKLYGKDLPCPPEWGQAIAELVHPRLAYHGEQDASASLRPKARSVTQMCYYGPGHTCTPLHRDLCSSLGQNLMVWSDPDATALWIITHHADAEAVDEYIASKGGDPYSEGYAPHPNELRDAPFPISCWKQRVGDLVLIPARAAHMVINTGGRTFKAAWSRLTIDTLTSALLNDLPLYQRVCRMESYHIKPVIEETLVAYTGLVKAAFEEKHEASKVTVRDLRGLLQLYDAIIADMFVPDWRDIKLEGGYDSYVECDFCGADVLHGYFECPKGETLCPLCYCQGRLCSCPDALEALQPRQHWRSFGERLQFRNDAAQVLLMVDPSLALPIKERPNAADDEAVQEPDLLPVEVLKEEDVGKGSWPFSFLAAMNLYKLRQTAGWRDNVAPCKICKANVDLSQRYHCKPCNHSYCHGCLLHKLFIHPAHTLAQNEPKQFHGYHKKLSSLDYQEWKQDPLEFRDEARAHFALIEAARTKMKCSPINAACRIGFLDVTDKYPHGLSGTLGVKRRAKSQVDKVKTATAPSSSSPPSTSGSRKRSKDSIEPASAPSSRSRSNKKAKLDPPPPPPPPSNPEPMDQDDVVVQVPRTPEAIEVPSMTPVLLQLPPLAPVVAPVVDAGAALATEQTTFSVPTVANGIRKFVLREGKVHPVHPVPPVVASQRAAQQSSVSPTLISSIASPASPTKPTTAATSSTNGSAHPATPSALQATPSVLAGPVSTASVPKPRTIATVPRPSTSKSPPVLPTSNGGPSAASVSMPAAKPTPAPAAAPATATAPTMAPTSSTPRTVTPPSAAATQTRGQGTLALATSVVAAGISSSPKPPATGSPDATPAGLGSLDSMNLRVITEILRIFSQSNERFIQTQMKEMIATLTKQAAEDKQQRAKQEEEHKRQQAKKDNEIKRAMAKMEATLLQRMERDSMQLRSELREMESKRQEEVKALRQGLAEVVQQQKQILQWQATSGEQVGKLDEKIAGLLYDIDQQAQALLQAELATRSSQPTGSGQAMPSAHFTPTSNTR